jgi:hypothetical protein
VRSVAATEGGTSLRTLLDSGADVTILPLAVLQNAQVDQVGRDVLNQMVVTLNGLAHIVEVSP